MADVIYEFNEHYTGLTPMHGSLDAVAAYLANHQEWFSRCAAPMRTEPLGANGYVLTIGQYRFFGYAIEPKIGLTLIVQSAQKYRIETVEIPGHSPEYAVDFCSNMILAETLDRGRVITSICWSLSLGIVVRFPDWMRRFPQVIVHKTASRLLTETVRFVSCCLEKKIQADFSRVCASGLNQPTELCQ
ncbi:DUF1997 domain-containing protein [Leptolyngbya sp. AN03gr2]|uniref:DUF1997 domain-containing protein n=1 Tax=unclassified Leptolyngbya TaxID=2650499 RepID=UPI003D31D6C4